MFTLRGGNRLPCTWDSYKLRVFRLHSKTRNVKLQTDFFPNSERKVSSKAALHIALPPWDNIYIYIYLFPKHLTPFHFIIKNISHVEAKDPAAIYVTFDDTPYINKKNNVWGPSKPQQLTISIISPTESLIRLQKTVYSVPSRSVFSYRMIQK